MQNAALKKCEFPSKMLNGRPSKQSFVRELMSDLQSQSGIEMENGQIWTDARISKGSNKFKFNQGKGKSARSLTGRVIQRGAKNAKCLTYSFAETRFYQRSCRGFKQARVVCKAGTVLHLQNAA